LVSEEKVNMSTLTIVGVAVGLAMDAFAVSIASGVTLKDRKFYNAAKMALWFGSFQMIMPLIGWASGIKLRGIISGVDHYIAFGLLTIVGLRMIYESARGSKEYKKTNPFDRNVLLALSIATSIDALAIGVSFAFLKVSVLEPILTIGAITFALSFAGVFAGIKFGQNLGRQMEIVGGVILIAIGLKILIAHMG